MKKLLYFILLGAELFVSSLFLSSLWMSTLYIPFVFAIVALAAILIWQIVLYTKATDAYAKRKFMVYIALAMLIPIAVFVVTYVGVAIIFTIAYV
jgi:hypothetical protein